MKIRAIAFDWGGVIEILPIGNFGEAAAKFLGVDGETYRAAYFLHNHKFNVGKDSKTFENGTEVWASVLTKLGKIEMLGDFMNFIQSMPKGTVDQRVIELIKQIKQAGYKVGLLSNQAIEGAQKIRATGYDKLFDVALFSAEMGFMKPQPAAFQELMSRLDVSADELIFIDDTVRSLSTSEEIGYTPILYKGFEDLITQLNKNGIKISI